MSACLPDVNTLVALAWPNHDATPQEARQVLRELTQHGQHVFWPDDLDFTSGEVPFRPVMGHRQVTDAYLLALAIHRGGQLVTLDRSLPDLLPAASPHRERVRVLGRSRA